jgi:hypothetical protein
MHACSSVVMVFDVTIEGKSRKSNWWGRIGAVGLLVWFLCWFKNEPHGANEQTLFWGPLLLIHALATQAARQRYGWFYLLPFGIFWILVAIALLGGIPH